MPDAGSKEGHPLTDEIYCFMARHGMKYYTLAVSPLWKEMIGPKPETIRSSVGRHVFIGSTDQVTYLLPYDHAMVGKYKEQMETLHLYPEGQVPAGLREKISYPSVMAAGIMPYFTFKITVEGELYKREGEQWKLCKV